MPRLTRRRPTLKPQASAEGAVDVDVEEDAVSAQSRSSTTPGTSATKSSQASGQYQLTELLCNIET
jgi:hypothetical protein